jgi:hypothetical protein
MKQDTPQWVREFTGKFFVYRLGGKHPDHVGAHIDAVAFIQGLLEKQKVETINEAIALSDKIEMSEPDGGTKQWMAFKSFRNQLRDIL